MNPVLREAPIVEAVDPLSLVPDPGPMASLYIDVRQSPACPDGYPDGMSLACAIPRRPYQEIVDDYARVHNLPGFDPLTFWNANFATPSPDDGIVIAPEGMDIDDYAAMMREHLMQSRTEPDGSFDFPLPHEYPGAGGRFNRHLYPWDAYHIIKGYASNGDWEKVINVVDDLEYQILWLGYPANGNSRIYASRFQAPYFSHCVRMLAEKFGDEALVRYLPALEREHQYHMTGASELKGVPLGTAAAARCVVRLPDGSMLNRYWDDADGPRLESYKEDVEMGEIVVAGLTGVARARRLQKFYKDIRGGAASGWDFSSRWFEDGQNIETINTTDIVPIDLNCLMVDSEETLAAAYAAKARQAEGMGEDAAPYWQRSIHYTQVAEDRKRAIVTYNWDPEGKVFRDHNFVKGRQTGVLSAAMAYPLYIGMANEEQTFGVARALRDKFLHPGGFISTLQDTGEQWDGRNVWAPPNWAASRGIARMAHILMKQGVDVEELFRIAEQGRAGFMYGVETAFGLHGIIPEKMDGFDPSQLAGGGEYALVKVLNMTLETYNALKAWNPREAGGCLPIGRLVVANA